jgi:hypothetical protein
VWPLGDDRPPDLQATPERVADAYVHGELGLGSEWQRSTEPDDSADNPRARKVRFYLDDGEHSRNLDVAVAQHEGLWFVTGSATSDNPRITRARVDGDSVVVEAVPDDPDRPPAASATAELLGRDGDVLVTLQVPIDTGLWRFTLPLDPGAQPAAVQVTTGGSPDERPSAGDALSFTSTIVLPATTADHPARPLFPAVMPASSYEDAWRYTLTHPNDPRRDWRWALTTAIGAVSNGRPSTPTFDDVVTRPDRFEMSGRYATADGGAGTFELARLRADGPWFVMTLQDDAFDVRNIEVTPTEAHVTVAVAEDYDLAVGRSCGGSAGQTVEQAWGHGGVELLCDFPMDPPTASDRTARSLQTLETLDDHSLLRYYDAWSPRGPAN